MKQCAFRIGLLFIFICFMSFRTSADGVFRIMEGITDNGLKTTMENNVNQMISAFNSSALRGGQSVNLSKQNFTGEAIKELSDKDEYVKCVSISS